MQTVYYLVHTASGRRISYYHTQRGARIGMRLRNQHLGFLNRVMLQSSDELGVTYEVYEINGELTQGTYSILESTVESPDLIILA